MFQAQEKNLKSQVMPLDVKNVTDLISHVSVSSLLGRKPLSIAIRAHLNWTFKWPIMFFNLNLNDSGLCFSGCFLEAVQMLSWLGQSQMCPTLHRNLHCMYGVVWVSATEQHFIHRLHFQRIKQENKQKANMGMIKRTSLSNFCWSVADSQDLPTTHTHKHRSACNRLLKPNVVSRINHAKTWIWSQNPYKIGTS